VKIGRYLQVIQSFICALVLIGSVLGPQSSDAATYYVATTGNDANSCAQARSESTPKRTGSSGVSCLSSGDTLYLRQGSYVGGFGGSIVSGGGSWASATKIASYPGETATLTGPGGTAKVFLFSSNSYVILDGLVLDGGWDGLKIETSAHHIRFINGEIKNSANQGVLTGGPGGNEFINCNIHHNGGGGPLGSTFEHAMYITDDGNGLIENCDIHDNTFGYGLHFFGGARTAFYTIRNNRIRNNQFGVLLGDVADSLFNNNIVTGNGNGIKVKNFRNKIYSNTVYGNDGYPGIWVDGKGHDIANNIVFQNSSGYGAGGIFVDSGANPGHTIRNNLSSGNGSNFADPTNKATLSNNLIGDQFDPLFVNAAAGDFHIQSGSQAVDVGITLTEVTTDYDGISRPQGTGYDMGAHEFQGGSTPFLPSQPTNLAVNP